MQLQKEIKRNIITCTAFRLTPSSKLVWKGLISFFVKERTKIRPTSKQVRVIIQSSTCCECKSKHVWWKRSALHFGKCPVRIADGTVVILTQVFRSSTQEMAVKYFAFSQCFPNHQSIFTECHQGTVSCSLNVTNSVLSVLHKMQTAYCQFFTKRHQTAYCQFFTNWHQTAYCQLFTECHQCTVSSSLNAITQRTVSSTQNAIKQRSQLH